MWRKKRNQEAEQGRASERQVQRSGGLGPAFSYYTSSRTPETNRTRPGVRQEESQAPTGRGRRLPAAQLPFWLLLALVAVCAVKVLWLSTNPKVVVVGKTSVSATYLQSTSVYAGAAHRLLASSITSRSKLTVNLNGTAAALEHQFPELQAVSLGMPLISSRPIVYVQVAQPSLILQSGSDNYALNKSGVVLAKVSAIPAGVPMVVDQSGVRPKPGKQFLPSSTVAFVQTAVYQLAAAHFDVSASTLPAGSPYELDVRLSGKQYFIKYNLQAAALTQSGVAVATLQQLANATPGSYLDVRVPGRVYYK